MYESFTLFFSISGGGREQCNAQRLLLLFTMQAREFSFPKINSLFKKGGEQESVVFLTHKSVIVMSNTTHLLFWGLIRNPVSFAPSEHRILFRFEPFLSYKKLV